MICELRVNVAPRLDCRTITHHTPQRRQSPGWTTFRAWIPRASRASKLCVSIIFHRFCSPDCVIGLEFPHLTIHRSISSMHFHRIILYKQMTGVYHIIASMVTQTPKFMNRSFARRLVIQSNREIVPQCDPHRLPHTLPFSSTAEVGLQGILD